MQLLTVKEVSARLKLSDSAVRALCDSEALLAVRPTGNPRGARRILADSVDAYLESLMPSKPQGQVFYRVNPDLSESEIQARINRLKKAR